MDETNVKAATNQHGPLDSVEIAHALEVLAYHDMNYLSRPMGDNAQRSAETQRLLRSAAVQMRMGRHGTA